MVALYGGEVYAAASPFAMKVAGVIVFVTAIGVALANGSAAYVMVKVVCSTTA